MSNLSPVAQLYGKLSRPDTYSGETSITPKTYRQELSTSGMVMNRDVVIQPIPYREIWNGSNGYTAEIAWEG